MKLRPLKRFFFVALVSAIFLYVAHLIDTYFFVNYNISEFVLGFLTCFISASARGFFNHKFPRTDGYKDFSYDTFFNNDDKLKL